MNSYLPINASIGHKKPNTLLKKTSACPFCDLQTLTQHNELIKQQKTARLIKNKYPVLEDSLQTVLIEHDTCEYDFSTYPKPILYNVIDFSLDSWLEMDASKEFTSAILMKNHGTHSGGSIFHPHMQIIGLEHLDYRTHIKPIHFEGVTIEENDDIVWNISTHPTSEFYEFNIKMKHPNARHQLADKIQTTTHYILHHLNPVFKSYNLAFYELNGEIIVKIISRGPLSSGVSSIFYLGYNISQTPTNIEQIKHQLLNSY